MRTAMLYISILAFLSLPVGQPLQEVQNETCPLFFWMGATGPGSIVQRISVDKETPKTASTEEAVLTAMDGLDMIQRTYAANFEKEYYSKEEYYYRLSFAEYYLYYEGQGETDAEYLYHLYEFVTDDVVLNTGHTVTYGWYTVNKYTEEITEITP